MIANLIICEIKARKIPIKENIFTLLRPFLGFFPTMIDFSKISLIQDVTSWSFLKESLFIGKGELSELSIHEVFSRVISKK